MPLDRQGPKAYYYEDNRDIERDGFELCLSQAFLGPFEIQLCEKEFAPLSFTYANKETQEHKLHFFGVMGFRCIAKNNHPLDLRIQLQYIEGVQVFKPLENTNFNGAMAIKISLVARRKLRSSLNISTEVIKKSFPLSGNSTEEAFSTLFFIFKSWNEANSKHFLRLLTRPHSFRSFDELQIRFRNWLIVVRDEDIKTSKSFRNVHTENPFLRILSSSEWLDLIRKINLTTESTSNCSVMKYIYCRPGQILAPTQPKPRSVMVQSMLNSPEKKFDWLSSIPQKEVQPAPTKTLVNNIINNGLKRSMGQMKKPTSNKEMIAPKRKRNAIENIVLNDEDSENTDTETDGHSSERTTASTTLLKYGTGKTSLSLSFGDVDKLSPDEFLNDSIIEFYLRFLVQEGCHPETSNDVYVFNTFLFARLIQGVSKEVTSTTARGRIIRKAWVKKNYELVKKWTRDVDIFSKKILIFPINYDDHWYIIIVESPGKAVIKGSTPEQRISFQNACKMFVFNSLRVNKCLVSSIATDVIRNYLTFEFAAKNTIAENIFSETRVVEIPVMNISGQTNLVDCGAFSLAYAELFLMWPPTTNNAIFDFNQRWPLFQETQMLRMRYKILATLRKKIPQTIWRRLRCWEKKVHNDNFTTEQRLEKQLENKGLRRWQSETMLRPKNLLKKRSKSRDRAGREDHLNRVWYPLPH